MNTTALTTAPELEMGEVEAPDIASRKPDAGATFAFMMMVLGMFLAVLDIQIVAASLSEIQAGLAASNDEIAWVQTAYLVAEVVMIPLCGFLSRALSIRWLFVLSCAGFTLSSLLCSMVDTIGGMIVARSLQGFLGGAMIPTVFSASMMLFGRKRQGGIMVMIGLVVTLAPTVGPALGGWITEIVSWHWLFLINVIPGIFISLAVATLVDFDEPHFELLKKIDMPGVLALAVMCGGLVFILEDGTRLQWFDDPAIRYAFVAVVAAAMLLWWRLLTAEVPIVNLRPFRNLTFTAGCVVGGVFGMMLFGLIYLYPLFLGWVAGMSSGQIGTTVFVTGAAMTVSAPLAGSLSARMDQRWLAIFGFLLLAVSTWMTAGITSEWNYAELFWPQVLRGVGAMFCMMSVSAMSFASLDEADVKDASGLFTLFRNIGGAIGIALINTLIQQRTNFHQARLAESINPSRPEIADRLEMMQGMATLHGMADPVNAALRYMADLVHREAMTMAIADAFLVFALIAFLFTLVPPFLAKPSSFADAPPDMH